MVRSVKVIDVPHRQHQQTEHSKSQEKAELASACPNTDGMGYCDVDIALKPEDSDHLLPVINQETSSKRCL
jgi:hypothetical protein